MHRDRGTRLTRALPLTWLFLAWLAPALAAAAPPRFDPRWLEPYFAQGPLAPARRALEAGAPKRAVALLRAQLKPKRKLAHELQARFLLGHALHRAGEHAEAAAELEALAARYPLLADHCRVQQARSLLRAGRHAEAEQAAAQVAAGSIPYQEAQTIRAEASYGLGRLAEAAALWGAHLKQGGGSRAKAHLRIAEGLEAEARKGGARAASARAEALEHYKRVTVLAPVSPHAGEAEKRIAALAAALGAKAVALSLDQRFERALALFRAQRNAAAEKELAALLLEKQLEPSRRCKLTFYLAKSIFKQRQRARSAPHYLEAVKLCRAAGESELTVKSLFDAGRALMNAHRYADAIRELATLERDFPSHSYADDARIWISEGYEALKQPDQMTRVLASLPGKYPSGDMAHEALWRLARGAYVERRFPLALAYLDRSLSELGRPRYYYALGQALYWRARVLEQTGKVPEALVSYEKCIREYPLSYYALLAFNRLRERHRREFQRLEQELIAVAGRGAGTWQFPPRELYAEPAFQRGVELARLGFAKEAERELRQVGLDGGKGRRDAWLAAVLFDRAGLWHLSHRIPRADGSYKRSYPLGEEYRRWAIAYPQGYAPLVRQSARLARLPEPLVYSIIREESGFSTEIESYANALGLMQLILPTARTAAAQQRLQASRESLADPAVNIRLGTTFLGFLYALFQKSAPLAIASYNAGEGATFKWLRQFGGPRRIHSDGGDRPGAVSGRSQNGTVPLDELVERIPYDQTRRYTKRVLSSVFTYSVLYGRGAARIPKLDFKLPRVKPRAFGSP